MVGNTVVDGVLTHCALLHYVCDLKAKQMNVHCSLNQELMLYEFKLSHNAVEITKNICYMKDEGAVAYNTVTRWFKKFCS